MDRPCPPKHLRDPNATGLFVPAPEVVAWIEETFLNENSPLYDEAHDHLTAATIAVLWTDVVNEKQMVPVVGTAEMPRPPSSGGKWARARWEMQMREWFGIEWKRITFLLTFYAPYAAEVDDVEWCSTVKHELCHCAVEMEFGNPKFREDGTPVFGIRDHDFGGFLSTVRDFGPEAERNVPELIEIVRSGPRISRARVAMACGTGKCELRIV
jgi:hypothetical protein